MEGENVTFGCDEGYELLGSPVLTCGSDGFWIGAWPTCVGGNADLPTCKWKHEYLFYKQVILSL